MDELTNTIEINIIGNYPHGKKQHAQIVMSGDGGIEHMLDAFKTALIAAGFSLDTLKKIDEIEL